MEKREIKPHKGGRDKQLTIRLTAEEKNELSAIAKKKKMNKTDLIVAAVRKFDSVCQLKKGK